MARLVDGSGQPLHDAVRVEVRRDSDVLRHQPDGEGVLGGVQAPLLHVEAQRAGDRLVQGLLLGDVVRALQPGGMFLAVQGVEEFDGSSGESSAINVQL